MISHSFHAVLLVSASLLAATSAHADGLFSIPIAQNPDKGATELIFEQDASGTSLRSPDTLRIGTVEYGLRRWLAVGFDSRLNGPFKIEPNIAVQLTREKSPIGVNIGYQNVGVRSFGEQPYAVASRGFGSFALHGGVTRDGNGVHPMFGLEKHFGARFEIMADSIGGAGNYSTFGGQLAVARNVSLAVGYMISNSRGDTNGLYLCIERDLK